MFVRVADHPGHSGQGSNFFRSALGVAAGDQNFRVRVSAMYAANRGTRVLIGGSGDGAGIQYNQISVSGRTGVVQTSVGKFALDGGAICLRGATGKILQQEARYCRILTTKSRI